MLFLLPFFSFFISQFMLLFERRHIPTFTIHHLSNRKIVQNFFVFNTIPNLFFQFFFRYIFLVFRIFQPYAYCYCIDSIQNLFTLILLTFVYILYRYTYIVTRIYFHSYVCSYVYMYTISLKYQKANQRLFVILYMDMNTSCSYLEKYEVISKFWRPLELLRGCILNFETDDFKT